MRRVAVYVTDYMDGQTAYSVWGDGRTWKAIEHDADQIFASVYAPSEAQQDSP